MPNPPSQRTLETILLRAVKLLSTIGTSERVLVLMRARGFSIASQKEGWDLILRAGGYPPVPDVVPVHSSSLKASKDAVAALRRWARPNFKLIKTALSRRAPTVNRWLFGEKLPVSRGAEALLSVKNLLDKILVLEHHINPAGSPLSMPTGPEAPDEVKAEAPIALSLLASRGYPEGEWSRLRALLVRATAAVEPVTPPRLTPPAAQKKEALISLYEWFVEWSSVAHESIRRRDDLIALGLAEKKKRP